MGTESVMRWSKKGNQESGCERLCNLIGSYHTLAKT